MTFGLAYFCSNVKMHYMMLLCNIKDEELQCANHIVCNHVLRIFLKKQNRQEMLP